MSESQSDNLTLKESFRRATLLEKLAVCLSSWCGAGLMPGIPGTFGTLAALPLVVFIGILPGLCRVLFLLIVIIVAVWASGLCGRLMGRDDPREVVIDEVAGFVLAVFQLPISWMTLCLGFILFRVFDILKPFPIGRMEKIRGGTGIVMDDLMAGVYANLCIRIFFFLFT